MILLEINSLAKHAYMEHDHQGSKINHAVRMVRELSSTVSMVSIRHDLQLGIVLRVTLSLWRHLER